ncbi:hypothetical protein ACTHP5_16790 [Bacillus subtilis]|uniref:hypothetical protein n=1 Tax=Bacillus TaxID=1386 RepID=UPI000310EAD5|nr:hypothetical protein [Bacillus subtilis]AMR48105.1 hypothetical protein KHRBS_17970 [Bacillus subtilis subsp. subtilis]KMN93572.1 hypothetical protein VL08_17210 [Bacillus subtilis]MDH3146713.1 hypothetical protein [Bacillus subtilis]MED4473009.1 hypothetical protein [Bacillus subtilis]QGH99683.1 hypothetical protein GII77_04045 [Bacillus subtilis]
MKKKRFTFGLLGLMVCVILFVQLLNKDSIPVQSSSIHSEEDRIFFIYSNPFIKESVLLSTSTGERFNRRTFKVADVPYIQTKSYASTDLVLLAEHEPFYYTLEKDAIKEHPLSDPFAFWHEGKDVSVKAYNVDTTGNEIHINDRKTKKEYTLTLPSLVTMGASDENYIYIIQSMSIYVIDRKTEEMIETLSLASYADQFVESEEFIVASSEHELTVIEKGTWKTTYIAYPEDLEYADTVYYDKESGSFYVTYEDKEGEANLLKYGKEFSFHTYSLNFPYMEAEFKANLLYIVAQEEHKKGIGGYVGVFDIHSKKMLYQFDLPEEQVKVQDFVVVD